MSPRPVRHSDALQPPPLLVRVIEAARFDPDNLAARTGHAKLLEELSQWAVLYVPANGVLAPGDEPAYNVIEAAAVRNLDYERAREAFRQALESVELNDRNAIEEAHNWLQSGSDIAYFYAGLACGITLADLSARR
jgi:hypothetical protein